MVSENKKSAEIRMLWQINDLNGRKMNQRTNYIDYIINKTMFSSFKPIELTLHDLIWFVSSEDSMIMLTRTKHLQLYLNNETSMTLFK